MDGNCKCQENEVLGDAFTRRVPRPAQLLLRMCFIGSSKCVELDVAYLHRAQEELLNAIDCKFGGADALRSNSVEIYPSSHNVIVMPIASLQFS